jgi:hypothetical protein
MFWSLNDEALLGAGVIGNELFMVGVLPGHGAGLDPTDKQYALIAKVYWALLGFEELPLNSDPSSTL